MYRHFIPQPGTIPWAFECEERRPLDYDAGGAALGAEGGDSSSGPEEHLPPSTGVRHPHILQMTSGQQLLGFVEARNDGGWGVPSLPESASGEEGDGGEGQDSNVAMRAAFSGLRSVDGQPNYAALSLTWQGALLAEAVRLRDDGKGEDVIVVKTQREPQQEKGEAPCFVVRGLDTSALLSQHVIEDMRAGQTTATHLMICHRTPLVRHLHIVSARDHRVEARISRGWKPPSHLWSFQPRSPDHDHGAYYVERTEARGEQRQALLLHPAVMVLACAYKTLDREEEERRKAEAAKARAGGAPRIARMARSFLQNMFDKSS